MRLNTPPPLLQQLGTLQNTAQPRHGQPESRLHLYLLILILPLIYPASSHIEGINLYFLTPYSIYIRLLLCSTSPTIISCI